MSGICIAEKELGDEEIFFFLKNCKCAKMGFLTHFYDMVF